MSGSSSPTRSRAPEKKPVAAAKNPEPAKPPPAPEAVVPKMPAPVKPPPVSIAAVPKNPAPVKPPPVPIAVASKKPPPDHSIPKSKIPRPLAKQPSGKDAPPSKPSKDADASKASPSPSKTPVKSNEEEEEEEEEAVVVDTIAGDQHETEEIKAIPSEKETEKEICPICLDDCTEPKQLDKCGHKFCKDCIDHYFQAFKPQCPCCFTIYGEIRGNQPENGKMIYIVTPHILPGFKNNATGTIKITYYFPSGIQDERHPNPGMPYSGTTRDAYLPDNPEGRHVLSLLEKAFELRQIFTVGQSRTTGSDNVVTWNDIHHKTSYRGGMQNFGYPDNTYLNRVQQELAAKGIK